MNTGKRRGGGERGEKINKGENYDKMEIYFPPICTVPVYLGEKISHWEGGEYD